MIVAVGKLFFVSKLSVGTMKFNGFRGTRMLVSEIRW